MGMRQYHKCSYGDNKVGLQLGSYSSSLDCSMFLVFCESLFSISCILNAISIEELLYKTLTLTVEMKLLRL